MSWKKLSEYFGIPYRTLQDWYMGKRKMPEYLLRLMIYKSEIEKICQKPSKEISKAKKYRAEYLHRKENHK